MQGKYTFISFSLSLSLSHYEYCTVIDLTYVKVKGCQLECKLFDMPHLNVINYILNSFCIFTQKYFVIMQSRHGR